MCDDGEVMPTRPRPWWIGHLRRPSLALLTETGFPQLSPQNPESIEVHLSKARLIPFVVLWTLAGQALPAQTVTLTLPDGGRGAVRQGRSLRHFIL